MDGIIQNIRNMIITIDHELQIGGRTPFYLQPKYREFLPLQYFAETTNPNSMEIVTFADSSASNHVDDRTTQCGYLSCLNGTVVIWKSFHTDPVITPKSTRDNELLELQLLMIPLI